MKGELWGLGDVQRILLVLYDSLLRNAMKGSGTIAVIPVYNRKSMRCDLPKEITEGVQPPIWESQG